MIRKEPLNHRLFTALPSARSTNYKENICNHLNNKTLTERPHLIIFKKSMNNKRLLNFNIHLDPADDINHFLKISKVNFHNSNKRENSIKKISKTFQSNFNPDSIFNSIEDPK